MRLRIVAAVAVAAATGVVSFLTPTSQAAAYDGQAASAYADTYALLPNKSAYPFYSNDCANFVSQSLHAGGFSMVNYGANKTDDNNWWINTTTPILGPGYSPHSNSWAVAADLYSFLHLHSPGGHDEGTASGASTYPFTPDAMLSGDVVFYDFGQGAGISHAAIQVGTGTDPSSGLYGNLIDQHTNNRQHAFWSLQPYNDPTQISVTTIYFVHVDSGNG